MDNEQITPVDVAIDDRLGFNSEAARDWFDPDELAEVGLYEDGHGYELWVLDYD
jgi:hypothetical protein